MRGNINVYGGEEFKGGMGDIDLQSIVLKRGGVIRFGITGGKMGTLPEVTLLENKIKQIRIVLCCIVLIIV